MIEWYKEVVKSFEDKKGVKIQVEEDDEGDVLSFFPEALDGSLKIYFNAYANLGTFSGGRERNILKVYSRDLPAYQRWAIAPSSVSTVIYDPKGTAVAEVVGNTLFILFALSNLDPEHCQQEKEILGLILEDYFNLPDLVTRRESMRKKMAELQIATFGNFSNFCIRAGFSDPVLIRQKFEALKLIAKDGIIVINDEIRLALGKVALRGGRYGPKKLGRHYISFRQIKEDEDLCYDVEIFVMGQKESDHPNVYLNGGNCLGDVGPGIRKFLKEGEFDLAAKGVKLFLERDGIRV